MKTPLGIIMLATAALTLAPLPALADGTRGNGNSQNRVANPSNGHCPPGLAKKNPPCVPPGQARQAGYRVGDRLDRDYVILSRDRYRLPPLRDGEAYVRVGNQVLRLDRDERIILDIVDLILN
ncbi:hypothetical protein SAMN05444004_109105 [Jannaschia faecimaris]|uniref:Nickel/cobalt transporter regulator n=1 Tax=Jannaschia faecimaris TaxID=1244108 RepID=A0A1H3RTI6_9RHOB|nr:RcnB family protein [Jannaschia faecimaris]SDZ28551.1 hypothetical protein SAMN05444004_109105 [Jannaschia faecimaris]